MHFQRCQPENLHSDFRRLRLILLRCKEEAALPTTRQARRPKQNIVLILARSQLVPENRNENNTKFVYMIVINFYQISVNIKLIKYLLNYDIKTTFPHVFRLLI